VATIFYQVLGKHRPRHFTAPEKSTLFDADSADL